MSEQDKDVVRRLIGAFDRHDFDALDELLAENFVWHGGSFGEVEGLEAFKQLVRPFYEAFPDLRIELHELIAERDRVVTRFTTTGTHSAEFAGVPATGGQIRWNEHPIYRVADERVAEAWWVADIFGLMQQLGEATGAQEKKT